MLISPRRGLRINIRRTLVVILIVAIILPSYAGMLGAAQKSSSRLSSQRSVVSNRLKQLDSALSQRKKRALVVKKQVDSITETLNAQISQYNTEVEQLERTKAVIMENQAKLTEAEEKRSRCQEIVNKRAKMIYQYGRIPFLAVFLKAKTYRQFLVRIGMLQRIAKGDIEALGEMKAVEEEIISRGKALEMQKASENDIVADLRSRQAQIQSELVKANNLLARVKQEIDKLENERREARQTLIRLTNLAKRRRTATNAYAAVNVDGFIFPVAGPHGYSDNFGDYRSGGRTHKGIDIFALRGTPAVAVVDGTIVTVVTQVLGGKVIRLRGNEGNIYSYAHLDGYAPGISGGTSVTAGQTIGYVGDTGNAKGGVPHLHFEFHPGGGEAVNAYPLLKSAD